MSERMKNLLMLAGFIGLFVFSLRDPIFFNIMFGWLE